MSNEIILEKKNGWSDKEYYCDITRFLDHCSELQKYSKHFKNYVYDTRDLWDKKHWQSVFRVEQWGALK